MSGRICPSCKSSNIVEEDGNVVCQECGRLLEENHIVNEIGFGEARSGAAVVQGTYVSHEQGSARRTGYRSRMRNESREQTIAGARSIIRSLSIPLHISSDRLLESAQRYFNLALNMNFIQGRKTSYVAAACLYCACRMDQTSHMLIDFADVLSINVFVLGAVYLRLIRELSLQLPQVDPSMYIKKFAAYLDFGTQAETDAVATDAIRLMAQMKRNWMSSGRRPAGLCGACLIVAARMNGFRRSVEEVVQVVKIADVTIRRRLDEFRDTPAANLTISQFKDLHETVDASGRKVTRRLTYAADTALAAANNPPAFESNRRVESAKETGNYTLLSRSEQLRLMYDLADGADGGVTAMKMFNDDRALAERIVSQGAPDIKALLGLPGDLDEDVYSEGEDELLEESGEEGGSEESEESGESGDDAPLRRRSRRLKKGTHKKGKLAKPAQPLKPTGDNPSKEPPSALEVEIDEELTHQMGDALQDDKLKLLNADLERSEAERRSAAQTMTNITSGALVRYVGEAATGPVDPDADLDDDELDMYILTPSEVDNKRRIWMALHQEYLQALADKQTGPDGELRPLTKSKKASSRRKNRPDSSTAHAANAADATKQILSKKKFSKKINYDAIDQLFEGDYDNPVKKRRVTFTADEIVSDKPVNIPEPTWALPAPEAAASAENPAEDDGGDDDNDEDEEEEPEAPDWRALAGIATNDDEEIYDGYDEV